MSPSAPPDPPQDSLHLEERENIFNLGNSNPNSASKSAKRHPFTVKKQLFQTPATQPTKLRNRFSKTPPTNTAVKPLQKDSVTKRHYRLQNSSVNVTPNATRRAPSAATSTARKRPEISHLHTTPGVRPKYVVFTPEMWRTMQIEDLTAWLNSELVHSALGYDCVMMSKFSDSAVFLKQVAAMHHLYKSPELQKVLAKVDIEIAERRLFVSKKIHLSTHHEHKDRLISLILRNYNPTWLLIGLSALLECNIGAQMDAAVRETNFPTPRSRSDKLFMSVLEDAIRQRFLADDQPGVDFDKVPESLKRTSTASLRHESYNALILRRFLHLVFVLDQAKQARNPIIPSDPPLFRFGSEMTSSSDVIEQMGKDFLPDHGNVSRFLGHRLYKVTYETPLFERETLFVKNLSEDLRDGTRLCKLASIMTKDRKLFDNIRRVRNGTSAAEARKCRLGNVSLALSKIQEHANNHLKRPFRWQGNNEDIVNQDVQKTIVLLWQVVGLWLETVVLDEGLLQNELTLVQGECREAQKHPRPGLWSPSGSALLLEGSFYDISPSRLTVYEKCESEIGHLLLRWCATVAQIYGLKVRDFCESFRDGAVLCIIIHHYCPALIRTDEIKPVQQADVRPVTEAEAEAVLVQKNFDLFVSRSRSLGTIPNIPIRAEAALGRSFTRAKDESFGRIMELLSSYLFRRLVMEKEGRTDREYMRRVISGVNRSTSSSAGLEKNSPSSRDMSIAMRSPDCLVSSVMEPTSPLARGSDIKEHSTVENCRNTEQSEQCIVETDDVLSLGEHGRDTRASCDDVSSAVMPLPFSGDITTSLRKKRAAEVIFEYYRCAKSRRQFLRMRVAATHIQSAFRRYLVQSNRLSSRLPPEIPSLSTTELLLKPWPAIETVDEGLKGFGADESKAEAVYYEAKPWRVIDLVSAILPPLRRHVRVTSNFAEQMIEFEKQQAETSQANVAQEGQRNHTHSNEEQGSSTDEGTGMLRSLTASLQGIASNASTFFISRAHTQSKASAAALAEALAEAEEAYEKTVDCTTARREQECEDRRRRRESIALMEEAAIELDKEIAQLDEYETSIEQDMIEVECALLESEKEGLGRPLHFDYDTNLDSYLHMDAVEYARIRREEKEGGYSDLGIKQMSKLEKEFSELREQCAREVEVGKEIDRLHFEWNLSLKDARDTIHRQSRDVMCHILWLAEYEFSAEMASRAEENSHEARGREKLGEELSTLAADEKFERQQFEKDSISISDAICSLDLRQSEAHLALEEENTEIEKRCQLFNLRCIDIEEYEKIYECAVSVEMAGLDSAALACTDLHESYENWVLEEAEEEKELDNKIQRLVEEQNKEELFSRLKAGERSFSFFMFQNRQLREEDERRRALLEHQLLKFNEEDRQAASALQKDFFAIQTQQESSDVVFEKTNGYLESLATPARKAKFPSPNKIPGAANTLTQLKSPLGHGSSRLLEEMDDLTSLFTEFHKDLVESPHHVSSDELCEVPGNNGSKDVDSGSMGVPASVPRDSEQECGQVSGVSDLSPRNFGENNRSDGIWGENDPTCKDETSTTKSFSESARASHFQKAAISLEGSALEPDSSLSQTTSILDIDRGEAEDDSRDMHPCQRASMGSNEEMLLDLSHSESKSFSTRSSALTAVNSRDRSSCLRVLSSCENNLPPFSLRDNILSNRTRDDYSRTPENQKAITVTASSTHHDHGLTPKSHLSTPLERLLNDDRDSDSSSLRSNDENEFPGNFPQATIPVYRLRSTNVSPIGRMLLMGSAQENETPVLPKNTFDPFSPAKNLERRQTQSEFFSPLPLGDALFRSGKGEGECDFRTSEMNQRTTLSHDNGISEHEESLSRSTDLFQRARGASQNEPSHNVTPAISQSGPYSRGEQLRRLSSHLGELTSSSSRSDFISLSKDPDSKQALSSVLRRISVAASSPRSNVPTKQEKSDVANIIRTVFILIREFNRSSSHGHLVELGLAIVRDMAKDACLVDTIFTVEDWLPVLVTCMYCYQDQEKILALACESLAFLAGYEYGERIILADEDSLYRIRKINDMLLLQATQHQETRDRLIRAKALTQALRQFGMRRLSSLHDLVNELSSETSSGSQVETGPKEWLSTILSRTDSS